MREIDTEIVIDAAPERVWEILTEFESFPDWNPFMRRIEGEPEAGSKLEVELEPPDGKAMTFKPTVLVSEANRELRWLGRLLLPRIFDGEHVLELSPIEGGGTRFAHREEFRGLLVPLLGKTLERTERGFRAMNEALKERAEAPER